MHSALIAEGPPSRCPSCSTPAAAEAIMRAIPVQAVPGVRKLYLRRSDVVRFLDENLVERGRPN